jgi:hypothetical protein
VHASAKKGPDCQHDCAGCERLALRGHDAGHATVHDNQIGDFRLEKFESGLRFEQVADRVLIECAIRLCPRRAHRWALARIQGAKLDTRTIGGPRHRASERVDLADQVPLADAADRRVATHLADGRQALGHEQRARAHPGSSECRLGAGVAAADDDDVESIHVASVRNPGRHGTVPGHGWHAPCMRGEPLAGRLYRREAILG